MLVKRTSMATGKVMVKDLPITEMQLMRWADGEHIQDVMPNLSSADREFMISGCTEDEWDELMAEPD